MRVFFDRARKGELPPDLIAALSNCGCIDSESRVSFVGFLLLEGDINLFVPRGSNISKVTGAEVKRISFDLMKAIERFSRSTKNDVRLAKESTSVGISRLALFRQLLFDFLSNGLYSARQQARTLNNGKPDWHATIASHLPVITRDSLVYLDVASHRTRSRLDPVISCIHAESIRTIEGSLTPILTGKEQRIAPELKTIPPSNLDRSTKLIILRRQLQTTYSDREIWLLNSLIDFYQGAENESGLDMVCGVSKFHFAWEWMLRSVLSNTINLNSSIPAPAYTLTDGSIQNAFQSSMLMDIAVQEPNSSHISIIDAKYYEAMSANSAPPLADIVKQFFYEKALKWERPSVTISNFFVFPGAGPIRSTHLRSKLTGRFADEEFQPIKCVYADPIDVVQSYADNKILETLSTLLARSKSGALMTAKMTSDV